MGTQSVDHGFIVNSVKSKSSKYGRPGTYNSSKKTSSKARQSINKDIFSQFNMRPSHGKYENKSRIHEIARFGFVLGVKKYLDDGIPVNLVDEDLRTPLHLACMYGQHEVVEILLARGANLHMKDVEDKAPADYIPPTEKGKAVEQVIMDHVNRNEQAFSLFKTSMEARNREQQTESIHDSPTVGTTVKQIVKPISRSTENLFEEVLSLGKSTKSLGSAGTRTVKIKDSHEDGGGDDSDSAANSILSGSLDDILSSLKEIEEKGVKTSKFQCDSDDLESLRAHAQLVTEDDVVTMMSKAMEEGKVFHLTDMGKELFDKFSPNLQNLDLSKKEEEENRERRKRAKRPPPSPTSSAIALRSERSSNSLVDLAKQLQELNQWNISPVVPRSPPGKRTRL